jgi:hypothetical protein
MYRIHRAKSTAVSSLLFVGWADPWLGCARPEPRRIPTRLRAGFKRRRLAHAQITVRARESASERQATADDRGEFRLNDLPPRAYRLTVSAPGFAEAQADVQINPGANYVANVSDLPVSVADQHSGNVTAMCTNPACTATAPVTGLQQLAIPAGALGDFFGPGTTVGIPFAAQIGARVTF